MEILDIFYDAVIPEATKANIVSYFYYNIAFSTYIVEDDKLFECKIDDSGLVIPTLVIKNKERINKLLIEYVKKARKFYDDSNFDEDVLNRIPTYEDSTCEEKTIMANLFANANAEDFLDFENYLRRRINFFEGIEETKVNLGYVSSLNSNMEIEIMKDIINNEGTHKFIVRCINEDGDVVTLPKISFGISDNKVYVYTIQNPKQAKTTYSKKINRVMYKVGEGFDSKVDNYETCGEGNLNDVTHSFVFVLNAFMSYMKKLGYEDYVVIPFLPERWTCKRIAYQKKAKYHKLNLDDLYLEHISIQNNLTQKFVRTFLRLAHHRDDISVSAFPLTFDLNMLFKMNLEKGNFNNTLLKESDDIIFKI